MESSFKAHGAPFAVVGFTDDLRVRAWSGRAEQIFGRTEADALGGNVAELVPVDGGEARWRELLSDDDGSTACLQHADGRVWEWTLTMVRDGEVRGVVCYGRDVTERVAEKNQAELDRVMLHAILDNLPVVAVVLDKDGTYQMMEGKGLEGVGVKPGQMVGLNALEVLKDNPEVVEYLRRGLAGIQAPPSTLFEYGRYMESWHIPLPPGGRSRMVSISLDVSESRLREMELLEKLDLIERQQRVIRELSTPIIEVWEGVVALPIIGLVDSMRTSDIMDSLLQTVVRLRARHAILDMTGVDVVDTATANHLIGMIRAVRLLGAEGILTGIHPGIAQTIVTLGVDLRGITVHATLRQALVYCIGRARKTKA
ncbi:MAG TPA: PAS domain-containing protein [Nannocystis sp.]